MFNLQANSQNGRLWFRQNNAKTSPSVFTEIRFQVVENTG